ncbi:MAG: phage/plasmid primase, P4 family [Roseovarius sp.]|jgi:putative DNA primase/helicase|uniref:phage/plasmid primase, P4 family n=1 Tax=Roseovarius sp. TaxID=1486281 RepID=UPI0032EDFBD8
MMNSIENAPEWLVEKLTSSKGSAANTNSPVAGFMREGSRNNDLTSLAGFYRRKHGYDADQLYRQLMVTNAGSPSPLAEAEVRAIAKSVSGYAANGLANYDDVPLSRELAAHLSPTFRSTEAVGWMAYDGIAWEPDTNGSAVQECAKKFAERIYESAHANSDPDNDAAKRARQILGAGKLAKAISLAASDDCLRTKWASYDAQPSLFNLQNGTLDLSTGLLRDHDPDDLVTKVGNARFDHQASCPFFDKLLEDILPQEHRDFALRLFGYALLGQPKEQVFILCYGPGANGKSTLVNAVTHAMGGYAMNAEPSTFIKQKNPGIRNDLARLKGARMVATSELATGEILDAPLVKRITGGDPITARFLHKELFEFDPEFVMFMITNALPVINGADGAMGRRIALIPFNKVIPEEKRDSSLPEKLQAEASGILNRLLEGLESYRANGLAIPEDLKAEAARYVQSSDMIFGFIEDSCNFTPDGKVGAKELQFHYRMWCGENGLRPLSQPQFRAEMIKKTKIVPTRTKEGMVWSGVSLRRSRH